MAPTEAPIATRFREAVPSMGWRVLGPAGPGSAGGAFRSVMVISADR